MMNRCIFAIITVALVCVAVIDVVVGCCGDALGVITIAMVLLGHGHLLLKVQYIDEHVRMYSNKLIREVFLSEVDRKEV